MSGRDRGARRARASKSRCCLSGDESASRGQFTRRQTGRVVDSVRQRAASDQCIAALLRSTRGPRGLTRERIIPQRDRERRPPPGRAVDGDRAAVELDGLVRDGEPETGAWDFPHVRAAVEGLEYGFLILEGNSDSLIGDAKADDATAPRHVEP